MCRAFGVHFFGPPCTTTTTTTMQRPLGNDARAVNRCEQFNTLQVVWYNYQRTL